MSADQTSPSFCFPSTHGITASSLSSCSSPIHELNQHLCYGLFLPLLCSTMTIQVLTAVTGVLSILSQHCTVKCLFGNSKFQADEFNSPVPMELEVLGQYLTEQIWRPHWTRLQLNPGWMDRQAVPAPEAKTWKTNPDACLPHLAVGMSFGENSLVWHHFKHFTCQSLSSLPIKPTWHSSFTYMELWN